MVGLSCVGTFEWVLKQGSKRFLVDVNRVCGRAIDMLRLERVRLEEVEDLVRKVMIAVEGLRRAPVLAQGANAPHERLAAAWNRMQRLLLHHLYETIPGGHLDPDAPSGPTEDGVELPLRSWAERRHRETMTHLDILTHVLLSGASGNRPPGPSVSAATEPVAVLGSSGRPVSAIAVGKDRFAVGRGGVSPGGTERFELVCGTFASVAGITRPLPQSAGFPAATRIGGLEGWNDLLARSMPESNAVELGDWGESVPGRYVWERGVLDPGLLGIVVVNGVPHVVLASIDTDGCSTLTMWDRRQPLSGAVVLTTIEGRVEAFASRVGAGIACLVKGSNATSVVLIRAGRAVLTTPFGVPLKALAFAPDGTLWCLEEDGTAGTWDTQAGKYMRRRPFAAVGRFVVTAGGDLIGITTEARLMVARASDTSPVRAMTGRTSVCALAASPGGEFLMLGHGDGSVHFLDVRSSMA